MREMGNITMIGAFWKNDKPFGVGVVLNNDHKPLIDYIIGHFQSLSDEYDAFCNTIGEEAMAAKLFDQLAAFGSCGDELPPDLVEIVIQNIYWLEQHGFIQPDEFNGVLFAQEAVLPRFENLFFRGRASSE